jgi:hypothetical protein
MVIIMIMVSISFHIVDIHKGVHSVIVEMLIF